MPDLLGPDPCATCGATSPRPVCQSTCRTFLPYAAKRELLEALKAGGVKCKAVANLFLDESGENASWNMARSADGKRGHLIFIPEAQE